MIKLLVVNDFFPFSPEFRTFFLHLVFLSYTVSSTEGNINADIFYSPVFAFDFLIKILQSLYFLSTDGGFS